MTTLIQVLRRPWLLTAAVLLGLLSAGSGPTSLAAQELSLSTENDLFSHSDTPDDLYTFAVALGVRRGIYRISMLENAFTDRQAGTRFDETYLTAGRDYAWRDRWTLHAEAGLVRVGRGLFGQATQNAVHRLIGNDPVELRYLGTSLHPWLALDGESWYWIGGGFEIASAFSLEAAPGLRYSAIAGPRLRWQSDPNFAVDLWVAARVDAVPFDALAPHVDGSGLVLRLETLIARRIVVSWSRNEHGDDREHLGISYRFRYQPAGAR